MANPSARDRILDTAARLFYQEGYRATGIDRIIAEQGITVARLAVAASALQSAGLAKDPPLARAATADAARR